jgi:hypothetical protein
VPVLKFSHEAVMVRRLKEDVRVMAGGFPIRRVLLICPRCHQREELKVH